MVKKGHYWTDFEYVYYHTPCRCEDTGYYDGQLCSRCNPTFSPASALEHWTVPIWEIVLLALAILSILQIIHWGFIIAWFAILPMSIDLIIDYSINKAKHNGTFRTVHRSEYTALDKQDHQEYWHQVWMAVQRPWHWLSNMWSHNP